jgi:hypothetical protein
MARITAAIRVTPGEPLKKSLHRSQLPLPEGFDRKAAIYGVEGSVTIPHSRFARGDPEYV